MTNRRQAFGPIDRFIRRYRARATTRLIPAGSRVLDVGCGSENWLVRSASNFDPSSLGIDPDLGERFSDGRGRRAGIEEICLEQPMSFDAVTSLAVIEHIPVDKVGDHLDAIATVLRPGGTLVLTTPPPRARPLLEFLAYRLHLISEHEIRDHRHYYEGGALSDLVRAHGFEQVEHSHFLAGLNQRVVARRSASEFSA